MTVGRLQDPAAGFRRCGPAAGFRRRGLIPRALLLAVAVSAAGFAVRTPPAAALNPIKPVCTAAGWFSGLVGKVCTAASHGGQLLSAGKKLLTGHPGAALKTALRGASAAPSAGQVIGLAALVAWVNGGAKAALGATATVLDRTTRPQLATTWFSSTYWRMGAIAALLTLPFLFAAAIQALLHSDLTLLLRAAFGYLPLAMLAIAIAAPLTTLLLAASDEMSGIVSAAAGGAGTQFLARLGRYTGLLSLIARSPFLVFFVGLLTAAGAIVLWLEMLMRQAAIYIVVLLLPLAFAAFVWPARRTWAVRAVELLVALILSKFVIVAVLSLGGAALGRGGGLGGGMLAGLVLITLGAIAPWALLRLLPFTELASSAAGHLRGEIPGVLPVHAALDRHTGGAAEWATTVASDMRRVASETRDDDTGPAPGDDPGRGLPPSAEATAETEEDDALESPIAAPADGGAVEGPIAAPAEGDTVGDPLADDSAPAPHPSADAAPSPHPNPASEMTFPFERTTGAFVLGPEAFTRDGHLIGLEPPSDDEPRTSSDADTPLGLPDDQDPLPSPADDHDSLSRPAADGGPLSPPAVDDQDPLAPEDGHAAPPPPEDPDGRP